MPPTMRNVLSYKAKWWPCLLVPSIFLALLSIRQSMFVSKDFPADSSLSEGRAAESETTVVGAALSMDSGNDTQVRTQARTVSSKDKNLDNANATGKGTVHSSLGVEFGSHGQKENEDTSNEVNKIDIEVNAKPKRKKIMLFTTFWGNEDFRFGLGGPELFEGAKCTSTNCEVQSYKSIMHKAKLERWDSVQRTSYLGDFDAVVFSILWMDLDLNKKLLSSIDLWRRPHQRFILLAYENAGWQTKTTKHFNGFFNWTMTYRIESDVPMPYGWFTKEKQFGPNADNSSVSKTVDRTLSDPWLPYDQDQVTSYFQRQVALNGSTPESKRWMSLARRPKMVAWMVSNFRHNVRSKRGHYANELKKYISVDYFGGANGAASKGPNQYTVACANSLSGRNEQPRRKNSSKLVDNCELILASDYKFALSFENALCAGYASEKVYNRMSHAVAITLNQANMSQLLPPHSTISVFDFEDPEALAKYLHYLDTDDVAYLSYFWWQRHYRVQGMYEFYDGFCRLCDKLHKDDGSEQVYDDMIDWWFGQSECGKLLPRVEEMVNASISSSQVGISK